MHIELTLGRLWLASAAFATLFSVLQTSTPVIRLWVKSGAVFGLLCLVVKFLSLIVGVSPTPLHMVGFTLSLGAMAAWPEFPQVFGNIHIGEGQSLVAALLGFPPRQSISGTQVV